MRSTTSTRLASVSLYGLGLLLLITAVYIVIKLSSSPDSDWINGAFTATPSVLLGLAAILVARRLVGRKRK